MNKIKEKRVSIGRLTEFTKKFIRACKKHYIDGEGGNADSECFILVLCELYCIHNKGFLTPELKARLEYFQSWPYNPMIGGFTIGEEEFQEVKKDLIKNLKKLEKYDKDE